MNIAEAQAMLLVLVDWCKILVPNDHLQVTRNSLLVVEFEDRAYRMIFHTSDMKYALSVCGLRVPNVGGSCRPSLPFCANKIHLRSLTLSVLMLAVLYSMQTYLSIYLNIECGMFLVTLKAENASSVVLSHCMNALKWLATPLPAEISLLISKLLMTFPYRYSFPLFPNKFCHSWK